MKTFLLTAFLLSAASVFAQTDIPAVYHNLHADSDGKLFVEHNGTKYFEVTPESNYRLTQMKANVEGTADGLALTFGPKVRGIIYYGFIPYQDTKYPQPVFFKSTAKISGGKATIKIKGSMAGTYDMIDWMKSGKGTIGYRVVNHFGKFVYDGKVSFKGTGPFEVAATMVEGPFVNKVQPEAVTISFETLQDLKPSITVDGKTYEATKTGKFHEILVDNLTPGSPYVYTINYGDNEQSYTFRTAPKAGTRKPFSFAYASDCRAGNGGGERGLYGANLYILKKIMALSTQRGVAFGQISGDMINGYENDRSDLDLQYANFKRSLEPFAYHWPVYISFGNHEMYGKLFQDASKSKRLLIDGFPFTSNSGESAFGEHFVLPENGPVSEDGAAYDPNPKQFDFPPYKENVFYYTYDNAAMIVLNSNYLFTPGAERIKIVSGNLHGYIMDQQLAWFKETLAKLESDANIDHVFVTLHTPFFPNGGHVGDDMWYRGRNKFRPSIAGKELEKGIIERRDQLLDLMINQNQKVRAIFTGDEHNYAKTEVGPNTQIYPEGWELEKLKLSRTIYQVNNGAAGAPYYAQEKTPWTPQVSGFTTQNAVVYVKVHGSKVEMEVINPDTLEELDRLQLSK